MNAPRSSPWGTPDNIETVIPGHVWAVGTPSHGGYAVDPSWARNKLSRPCVEIGESKRGYLWYEEDCAWAVLAFEVPECLTSNPDYIEQNTAGMHCALRAWYPRYCVAGEIPIAEDYLLKKIAEFKGGDSYWKKLLDDFQYAYDMLYGGSK